MSSTSGSRNLDDPAESWADREPPHASHSLTSQPSRTIKSPRSGVGGVSHSEMPDATPIRVTRPSDNALMWTWYSSPLGTGSANENPAGAGTFKYNLRLPGQLYDTTLVYIRMVSGRYAKSDPIGLFGGINRYAYVAGNPLSLIDLFGLACRRLGMRRGIWNGHCHRTGRLESYTQRPAIPSTQVQRRLDLF